MRDLVQRYIQAAVDSRLDVDGSPLDLILRGIELDEIESVLPNNIQEALDVIVSYVAETEVQRGAIL